jgi:ribonucleotide monophosphatase NagD (HAD superfamily)
MARALLARLAMDAHDVAVVGDRLATDMAMARSLSMTGVLVLTGATSVESVADSEVQPQHVIGSLSELIPEGISQHEPEGLFR